MKSPFLRISFPELAVNRLCRFSLLPATFRLLLRSCSSSRTLAVSIAVDEFLMPMGACTVAGVDVPLSAALLDSGVEVRDIDVAPGFDAETSDGPVSFEIAFSSLFFFRFLEPGIFFRA